MANIVDIPISAAIELNNQFFIRSKKSYPEETIITLRATSINSHHIPNSELLRQYHNQIVGKARVTKCYPESKGIFILKIHVL